MAEELNFHLLKLARPEREVPRSNFVAKTLAHLSDAEWDANSRAIEHVFEIHKYALRRFRAKKRSVLLGAHRADYRLEHEVEFARLSERARLIGFRRENLAQVVDFGQRHDVAFPGNL